MDTYQASYYNLRVDHCGATLLFNGKTGALLRLDDAMAAELAPLLGPARSRQAGTGYSEWRPSPFVLDSVPERVRASWAQLLEAGVFVTAQTDERKQLEAEYVSGRSNSPLYVTVTTTLNCNMRCYYCYQKDDQLDHMSTETCDEIASWLTRRITTQGHERLYLEWYGGEPMLNQPVIERLSDALIPFCDKQGVKYKASMICNGTNWPEDVAGFLKRTRIFRIQFSLDGPEPFHNKRRGKLHEDGSPGRLPSYQEVMATVGAVLDKVYVYFRINVDPWVGWSCLDLIDVFREKGWLESNHFYPYLAAINAMTEHCGFIEAHDQFKDFQPEFAAIQKAFYARLGQHKDPGVLEKAMYYPARRLINCAAVNHNAVVFGPNGLMYKCGLDVGDHFRAHDAIGEGVTIKAKASSAPEARRRGQLPTVHQSALRSDRWDRYDPFSHERCKECQYLPVCLGGCPKAQIERNESQIRASSAFFEGQFDRMIREYYDSANRTGALD